MARTNITSGPCEIKARVERYVNEALEKHFNGFSDRVNNRKTVKSKSLLIESWLGIIKDDTSDWGIIETKNEISKGYKAKSIDDYDFIKLTGWSDTDLFLYSQGFALRYAEEFIAELNLNKPVPQIKIQFHFDQNMTFERLWLKSKDHYKKVLASLKENRLDVGYEPFINDSEIWTAKGNEIAGAFVQSCRNKNCLPALTSKEYIAAFNKSFSPTYPISLTSTTYFQPSATINAKYSSIFNCIIDSAKTSS